MRVVSLLERGESLGTFLSYERATERLVRKIYRSGEESGLWQAEPRGRRPWVKPARRQSLLRARNDTFAKHLKTNTSAGYKESTTSVGSGEDSKNNGPRLDAISKERGPRSFLDKAHGRYPSVIAGAITTVLTGAPPEEFAPTPPNDPRVRLLRAHPDAGPLPFDLLRFFLLHSLVLDSPELLSEASSWSGGSADAPPAGAGAEVSSHSDTGSSSSQVAMLS